MLFNSIGVFDLVMSMAQGAKYMASAGRTPDQIAHYQEMPIWMTASKWAITSAVIVTLLLFVIWYSHAMGKRGVLR